MATWIDFRELRQRLDFAEVLKHYGVELKGKNGGQQHGFCPLPTHNGKRRSPSFSVNLHRRIFNCFGCQAKGNVLDFAARMEGLDPDDPRQLREAALKLADRYGIGTPNGKPLTKGLPKGNSRAADSPAKRGSGSDDEAHENAEPGATDSAVVNAPLDFELRGLDQNHPYLKARGFTQKTIEYFGLGYCSRGLMQGRIAISLRDGTGQLVGYAGRLIDDAAIDDEHPKYKFPGPRERGGTTYAVEKSRFLYHGHAIAPPVDDVFVVEGFPSTWWLWQHGHEHVVALMGASCSTEQARLIAEIVHPRGRIWMLSDGDEAGERCALSVLSQVASHRFCRWIRLDVGRQPTDLGAEELGELLESEVAL